VYCGRCHAEFFMPRCAGCDELIFDPTYTVAEGKKWHLVHFCCNVCDEDLCEKQYAKDTEEDDAPICLPCYNEKLAEMCGTCKKPITAGERAMRAGESSYHHNEECFRCTKCSETLDGKKCVQDDDGALFCSPCYKEAKTPPCGRCAPLSPPSPAAEAQQRTRLLAASAVLLRRPTVHVEWCWQGGGDGSRGVVLAGRR
jgi:hypothetical protein